MRTTLNWIELIANGLTVWSLVAIALVLLGALLNRLIQGSASLRHAIWLAIAICIFATPIASHWIPGVLPKSEGVASSDATHVDHPVSVSVLTDAKTDAIAKSNETRTNRREIGLQRGSIDWLADGEDSPIIMPQKDAFQKMPMEAIFKTLLVSVWFFGITIYLVRIWNARLVLGSLYRSRGTLRAESLSSLAQRLAADQNLSVMSSGRSSRVVNRFLSWGAIEVTISQSDAGPLIWGCLPARLLIPESLAMLPYNAQEAAIRHELAHVTRGDEWIRRYLLVLRTLFWFHPLVRYCCDQVQLFAEKACDDQVLRSGHKPSLYSSLLLQLGQNKQINRPELQSSGMAQSQVANRIKSILQSNVSRRPITRFGAFVITLALLTLTSAFAVLRPSHGEPPSSSNTTQTTPNQKLERGVERNVGEKDWPQFGGTATRNNTPFSIRIPTEWDLKSGKNVRWSMPLGSPTYGGVVVANGKVFVGTNNEAEYLKRFPKAIDLGVLLCFNETDGKFLWQHSNAKLPVGRVNDWPGIGICSAPLVDGERLWYVTNRGEVVCLDVQGFRDGENDGPFRQEESEAENEADVIWVFDMMKALGVSQHNKATCSVTCAGELLFVNTSEGLGDAHKPIEKEHAPSFVCLNRTTGSLLWKDSSPGANILHGQWSSPAYAVLGGTPQVIFGGGDGFLYGFLAEGEEGKSKLLWKFDCNPKDSRYVLNGATRNHIVASPVIYNGLIYVAVGEDPEHGEGQGHLWCIDPTKRGDVSPTLVYNANSPNEPIAHKRIQALDAKVGDYEKPNPNSAAVWHYEGLNTSEFEDTMHRTCSTVAIQNDLLFVPDYSGLIHCLDARTGKPHWTYDLLAACWASPLIVNGRVYVSDEDGDVAIFDLSEKMTLLGQYPFPAPIYSTPIVANDTLYIATSNRIFAIQEGTQSEK